VKKKDFTEFSYNYHFNATLNPNQIPIITDIDTTSYWNKRGSDMTQLSFDDNKGINIQ
jgi:hypothetical protein